MNPSHYGIEDKIEADHWWFAGRRKLLKEALQSLKLEPQAPILDIGISAGSQLDMFERLGYRNVVGMDKSETAIDLCARKGAGRILQADLSDLPFQAGRFKLVLAMDVLEHVDDDLKALHEIKRVLAPEGILLMTVPAFRSLWGLQDEVSHHKRRYRLEGLKRLMKEAGLFSGRIFYFNYLLFVPIWLARKAISFFGIKVESENQINTPLFNRLLRGLFAFDVTSAPHIKPPFGVSIFAMARN